MQFVAERNGWTKVGRKLTDATTELDANNLAVCLNAKSLQFTLQRRRARNEQVL